MAQEKSFDLKEEFAGVDFHSIRLEQRFVRAMETLMRRPDKSIWGAGENRAEAKAVCRMLGDEGFDRGEIIRARREAAIRRWVQFILKERGIGTTVFGDGYTRRAVEDFLEYSGKQSVQRSRDSNAAALGYKDFSDLVEDWRKREGCAA